MPVCPQVRHNLSASNRCEDTRLDVYSIFEPFVLDWLFATQAAPFPSARLKQKALHL